MEDPVVVESEMTYERQAIEQWFEACQQQGREPTCPVSGQIVKSTKVQPNVVLQRTIQEWTRRNAVCPAQPSFIGEIFFSLMFLQQS
jgi:hypothetical protein